MRLNQNKIGRRTFYQLLATLALCRWGLNIAVADPPRRTSPLVPTPPGKLRRGRTRRMSLRSLKLKHPKLFALIAANALRSGHPYSFLSTLPIPARTALSNMNVDEIAHISITTWGDVLNLKPFVIPKPNQPPPPAPPPNYAAFPNTEPISFGTVSKSSSRSLLVELDGATPKSALNVFVRTQVRGDPRFRITVGTLSEAAPGKYSWDWNICPVPQPVQSFTPPYDGMRMGVFLVFDPATSDLGDGDGQLVVETTGSSVGTVARDLSWSITPPYISVAPYSFANEPTVVSADFVADASGLAVTNLGSSSMLFDFVLPEGVFIDWGSDLQQEGSDTTRRYFGNGSEIQNIGLRIVVLRSVPPESRTIRVQWTTDYYKGTCYIPITVIPAPIIISWPFISWPGGIEITNLTFIFDRTGTWTIAAESTSALWSTACPTILVAEIFYPEFEPRWKSSYPNCVGLGQDNFLAENIDYLDEYRSDIAVSNYGKCQGSDPGGPGTPWPGPDCPECCTETSPCTTTGSGGGDDNDF